MFFLNSIPLSLHSKNKKVDLVAQLVEQYTFNVWALGSSPSQITKLFDKIGKLFCLWHLFISFYSGKLDKYYTGACFDLRRRFYEYKAGHSKFTSTWVLWRIVYKEEFQTLIEAKQPVQSIKKQKSRKYIEKLIGIN